MDPMVCRTTTTTTTTTGKLRVCLCTQWSYRYWSANLKIRQMLIIAGQLQLRQLSPRCLSRFCCRDSPWTFGLQTVNLVSSKHMGQKWPYLHSGKQRIITVIRTHLYACAFLMQNKAFDWVNHWTLAKKLLDRNVPLHIVKLFFSLFIYPMCIMYVCIKFWPECCTDPGACRVYLLIARELCLTDWLVPVSSD